MSINSSSALMRGVNLVGICRGVTRSKLAEVHLIGYGLPLGPHVRSLGAVVYHKDLGDPFLARLHPGFYLIRAEVLVITLSRRWLRRLGRSCYHIELDIA